MKYVISSDTFKSKNKAKDKLLAWKKAGTLDENAKVFEVKRVFKPIFKEEMVLEEEK